MKYILWFIKCLSGYGSVADGSICWFSNKFYNKHDYPIELGGDGTPSHFHEYTCSNCKMKFRI